MDNSQNVKFRPLEALDKSQYRQIRLECLLKFPDNFGTLYRDEVKKTHLKFDKYLEKYNSNNFLFGAFKNQNLIGICGYSNEARTKTSHRGVISHMFVKSEFAGLGIGTELLKATIDKAFENRELDSIELGVVSSNTKAIKIYRSVGFVQFGFLDKYYKYEGKYWAFTFMILARESYLESRYNLRK
ncbi:MAG: GNAT family protein [Bacteroidota bacterium]